MSAGMAPGLGMSRMALGATESSLRRHEQGCSCPWGGHDHGGLQLSLWPPAGKPLVAIIGMPRAAVSKSCSEDQQRCEKMEPCLQGLEDLETLEAWGAHMDLVAQGAGKLAIVWNLFREAWRRVVHGGTESRR